MPLLGLAIAGTGVLALGTSAYFGLKARSISQDVESIRSEWGPAQEADELEAQGAERIAILLGVAGGAALVGGIVTYLLSNEKGDQGLALIPSSDGAMLSFSSRL